VYLEGKISKAPSEVNKSRITHHFKKPVRPPEVIIGFAGKRVGCIVE